MKHVNDIKNITYRDFLLMFPLCSEPMQLEIMQYLSLVPPPEKICGKPVRANLAMLSYGQLDDLHDAVKNEDVALSVIRIIVGDVDIMDEKATAIYGFMYMVERELNRINKLFSSMEHHYTKEEIAAGVESLSFGSFGILDWYAKRMGIADQNAVRNIPWVRIYTCMNNDNQQQLYERRLQKQYSKGK